ncbi:hypothetical protein NIES2107_28680 [Nostoc carneum NIES-2107]|nr:hypothetical protein NIES2107_28680 [Nostoc carneum NIES-2107]
MGAKSRVRGKWLGATGEIKVPGSNTKYNVAKINLKFQTVQKSLTIKPIQIMLATDQSFGGKGVAFPLWSVTFFSQIGISF